MRIDWLQLKRLIGLNPATPLGDQEGQLRYVRDGSALGKLYLARALDSGDLEWAEVTGLVGRGTPTVAALAGAGSTATISVAGNDGDGTITLTPNGAGIAAGTILDLTFAVARPSSNYTWLMAPSSAAARALGLKVGRNARTSSKVTISTDTPLTSGSTYVWDYACRQIG